MIGFFASVLCDQSHWLNVTSEWIKSLRHSSFTDSSNLSTTKNKRNTANYCAGTRLVTFLHTYRKEYCQTLNFRKFLFLNIFVISRLNIIRIQPEEYFQKQSVKYVIPVCMQKNHKTWYRHSNLKCFFYFLLLKD